MGSKVKERREIITARLTRSAEPLVEDTALTAAMRYILKAESDDRRGARRKLYCIIAGSAVSGYKLRGSFAERLVSAA